jgi:hypothetical protein
MAKLVNKLCPPCQEIYKSHMRGLGSKGGKRKSEAKTAAVRLNATKHRTRKAVKTDLR